MSTPRCARAPGRRRGGALLIATTLAVPAALATAAPSPAPDAGSARPEKTEPHRTAEGDAGPPTASFPDVPPADSDADAASQADPDAAPGAAAPNGLDSPWDYRHPVDPDSSDAPAFGSTPERLDTPYDYRLPRDEPAEPKRVWYRGQLAAAYILGPISATALLVALDGAWPGALPLLLPSGAHWINGQVWKGFLAAGGMALSSGAGLLAGGLLACQSGELGTCVAGGFMGMVGGYVLWAAIDIHYLAYKDVTTTAEPADRSSAEPRISFAVAPSRDGGASALLFGTF